MWRYVLPAIVAAGSMAPLPAFSQTMTKETPWDEVRFVLEGEAAKGDRGRVLHYSPSGRMLLLKTRQGWSLREPGDGTEIRRLSVVSRGSVFLGWSPDSKHLAFSEYSKRPWRLVLVDAASGKECWRVEEILGEEGFFLFTPDSRSVAFMRMGHLVQRDIATGKELQKWRPGGRGLRAFSQDLRRACSYGEEIVSVWDVESKQQLWQTAMSPQRITRTYYSVFRFTPDGSRLIASAVWDLNIDDPVKDGTVILDVASGKKVWGGIPAAYLILSPNSRYLLVGREGVQWVD